MACGRVRHMFPGGNTSIGFYSYYGNIIGPEEADRIYIIKGGPGAGKSTFMKKIAARALEKGFDVEYFHCSSDNDSLDGVKIPSLGVALMDGTTPHIVEPKCPGAVDRILNFGDFWDDKAIRERKFEILAVSRDISGTFARAYRYLSAARSIWEDSAEIHSAAARSGGINRLSEDLIGELFRGIGISGTSGRQRAMFASAITPGGLCNYLDSLLAGKKVYCLAGGIGTGEEKIIDRINAAALARGLDTEVYCCALKPDRPEHLIIPALNVVFTTDNPYHSAVGERYKSFDMHEFMDLSVIESRRADLEQNREEFERLLSAAVGTLKRAKALHDRLEAFYVPNIRFSEIDCLFEKIMRDILKE